MQEALRSAMVAGSWLESRVEMEEKRVRESPRKMSMSGRSLSRDEGGREGRSHVGRRVLATPGGRRVELDASIMVNQAVGEHEDSVFWMRQRERLWRAM